MNKADRMEKERIEISRGDFLKITGALVGLIACYPIFGSKVFAALPEKGCSDLSQCKNDLEIKDLVTKGNPLVIDEKGKSVLIYTEVNGKNVHQDNPHWGVVFKNGKLQERAILKSYANPLAFHDALLKIGAKPGNNLNKDTAGQFVEGDTLDVKATWPGLEKELSLNEILIDEKGKSFNIRFGGNRKASEEQKTGCITCLESCWVSISSNANYPQIGQIRRLISPNSRFKGRADVLLGDGKPVILIYRVASEK
jgi:hypothetical protein